MADEITVNVSARLRKSQGSTELIGRPYSHVNLIDMTGRKGPTPGALSVPIGGVAVDLSELTTPGFCWLEHQGLLSGDADDNDYCEVGVRDVDNNLFFPLLELLPGMRWPLYLSRNLLEEFVGTGTATTGPTNQLFLKSGSSNTLVVSVEAYEK